ncbi:MAG: hypothetical protein ACI4QT_01770 [Kiritimatiellia bacterium]
MNQNEHNARQPVPRRRFHALHMELVAVIAIVLFCIFDFGTAVRPPVFPRQYTPFHLSWCRQAPTATDPLAAPRPDSPLLFAFGPNPSPSQIFLPNATPEPPHSVVLHAAQPCRLPSPELDLPEIPGFFSPFLNDNSGPTPAPPLFSTPRPNLALSTAIPPAPPASIAPSFAPVSLSQSSPTPVDTTNTSPSSPSPPVNARAYLSYNGETPLPIVLIETASLSRDERRLYEIDLLRRFPNDQTTQTIVHVEPR